MNTTSFSDSLVLHLVERVSTELNMMPGTLAFLALSEYLQRHRTDITSQEVTTIGKNQIQQVSNADSPTIFTTNQISGTAGATI